MLGVRFSAGVRRSARGLRPPLWPSEQGGPAAHTAAVCCRHAHAGQPARLACAGWSSLFAEPVAVLPVCLRWSFSSQALCATQWSQFSVLCTREHSVCGRA